MDQPVDTFLQCKRIAVVGMSRSLTKWGNRGAAVIKRHGYKIFAIHPEAQEVDGEKCYPNLSSLPEPVDGVWMCIPPERGKEVLREAAALGIRNAWLQPGAVTPELEQLGQSLGLNMVAGLCILNYLD